jgi:tRNA(fMet)-specific endonuclease VapC
MQRSEELLAKLEVIDFDENAAGEFDSLLKLKKLKKIGRADLLIASIVLARRDTLVTRNVKHFRQIPHLKFENWAD